MRGLQRLTPLAPRRFAVNLPSLLSPRARQARAKSGNVGSAVESARPRLIRAKKLALQSHSGENS